VKKKTEQPLNIDDERSENEKTFDEKDMKDDKDKSTR